MSSSAKLESKKKDVCRCINLISKIYQFDMIAVAAALLSKAWCNSVMATDLLELHFSVFPKTRGISVFWVLSRMAGWALLVQGGPLLPSAP